MFRIRCPGSRLQYPWCLRWQMWAFFSRLAGLTWPWGVCCFSSPTSWPFCSPAPSMFTLMGFPGAYRDRFSRRSKRTAVAIAAVLLALIMVPLAATSYTTIQSNLSEQRAGKCHRVLAGWIRLPGDLHHGQERSVSAHCHHRRRGSSSTGETARRAARQPGWGCHPSSKLCPVSRSIWKQCQLAASRFRCAFEQY